MSVSHETIVTPPMGPVVLAKLNILAQGIGHCVMAWVNLERSLLNLFSVATKMPLNTSVSVLENFKTFTLTLDVVDKSIKSYLSGKREVTYWNPLIDYVTELPGDRNYIVHTGMVFHAPGKPESVPEELIKPKIGPSTFSAFTGVTKRPPIDNNELLELYTGF